MIVVDTNIVAHMTFATPYSPAVSELHEANPVWEAPLIWKSEFLTILSLYNRRGLIDYGETIDALTFAERLIGTREHRVPAAKVLEAVIRSGCPASDCEFVVLASELGTRLLTYNRELIREFPDIATTPEHYIQQ